MPFAFVRRVSKGVPGRGLTVFLGVDSSTGIFGAGVPRTVTKIVARVAEGFGEGEVGEDEGLGVTELL